MEFIYVVKRYDLFDLAFPHGFVLSTKRKPGDNGGCGKTGGGEGEAPVHDVTEYMKRARLRGFFVERRWAEQDSSLKQIIPYTVVTDGESVLSLRRLDKGGERRLHGKLSIGVGGHINPVDKESAPRYGDDLIAAGAWREIEEELYIPQDAKMKVVGLVNDESNPVGSVHLGVVHVAKVDDVGVVKVREREQLEGRFVSASDIKKRAADPEALMETWSSLVAERLDEII
jgi:predicted NUDIX family phosphoesterase